MAAPRSGRASGVAAIAAVAAVCLRGNFKVAVGNRASSEGIGVAAAGAVAASTRKRAAAIAAIRLTDRVENA